MVMTLIFAVASLWEWRMTQVTALSLQQLAKADF
jgi:hypothetical protein